MGPVGRLGGSAVVARPLSVWRGAAVAGCGSGRGGPLRRGEGVRLGQPAGSALGSKSVCAGVVVRGSALLCVGVFAGHAVSVLVSGSAWPSWHARGQWFEPA